MRYAVIAPVAIAAAAWTVLTVGAFAQTPQSGASLDAARAVEVERNAEIASRERGRWWEAASLFREASRLRAENDPIALGDLRMAGSIYAALGQFERAKRTMLALADRAVEFGEVATAAHALMDAAHVAVELNDANAARSSYARVQRLAMSSHLTSEEQRSITARLEGAQSVLTAGP
jgi:hypothetical protein